MFVDTVLLGCVFVGNTHLAGEQVLVVSTVRAGIFAVAFSFVVNDRKDELV